jgi:Rod binding domain-containing protein
MDIQFPITPGLAAEPLPANHVRQAQDQQSGETFQQLLARAREVGKVADAAKQFEALIAGQVLKAAREASDGGWLGSDDQTGELTLEMAEQGFAQALAKHGGLGVSKMVTANLLPRRITTASSGPEAASSPAPLSTDSHR